MLSEATRTLTIEFAATDPLTSRRATIWASLRPRVEQLTVEPSSKPWLAVGPLTPEEVNTAV